MKKILLLILALTLVFALVSCGECDRHIDENGDGICDECDEKLAADPPSEDPPSEDPPSEDPPSEDPPSEDPPAKDPDFEIELPEHVFE